MKYGTVTYGERRWIITCEPFVRARIKRVFARAPQSAGERISLSATTENTRELQWFLDRYPMDVDRPDLLQSLADQHRAQEIRVAELMAGHIPPEKITLSEPPRSYQAFVPQLLQAKRGLLLADDLGLGKTVSAICCMVQPGALPAVVVVPAHLPRQWKQMINRFAPALSVHILKKGTPYDLAPKKRKSQAGQAELLPPSLPDVIITSYHKLRGWAETLAGQVRLVVFDECQALRSSGTEINRAANHLAASADLRLGLSATPIYNLGHEFYHVVNALLPEALGTREEFVREWCTADGQERGRLSDPKEFGAYLRREGIMLRRTRADVGRELPPLSKVIHEVDADEAALNALKTDAVALAKIVMRQNEQFKGQKMQAAGEFDNLMRQATGIAKAPYVAEFVKLLLESGEPIVLFGWHRAVYEIWMDELADHKPALYTGTESATQKAAAIEAFTSGQTRLLIMSLRSGAGVDGLQGHCNNVVFGELDWSPGVHEQCAGRVHRDGQDEACNAYFLVSESGADPIMAEVLGIKRDQIEGVRNPDMALAQRIDTGENSIRRLAREFLAKRGIDLQVEDAKVIQMEPREKEATP